MPALHITQLNGRVISEYAMIFIWVNNCHCTAIGIPKYLSILTVELVMSKTALFI